MRERLGLIREEYCMRVCGHFFWVHPNANQLVPVALCALRALGGTILIRKLFLLRKQLETASDSRTF